jgi:sulfonate transport system permease protein
VWDLFGRNDIDQHGAASSKGLGFLLIDSQNTGRTDVMLLAIVLLAALGKLSDWALGALEQGMVRRRG